MNPYEADPEKIPDTDRYQDVPLYGRYLPRSDDFKPNPSHINSTSPESIQYWESVLCLCNPGNRIYENQDGGRDVFALGSVIVKSSHLKKILDGRRAHRDYSLADANEAEATALVREHVRSMKVPKIYFSNEINGRSVLVQSRIPGVGLNVAWQYISAAQKLSFKRQARDFLHQIYTLPSPYPQRSYVVPDNDPVGHRGIQELEREIIFGEPEDGDRGFMHNDLTLSNIIVDHDKIVAVVDWEMAGYFGWKVAGEVHVQIRTPKRENFAQLDLPEELLADVLYWNDLFDGQAEDQ